MKWIFFLGLFSISSLFAQTDVNDVVNSNKSQFSFSVSITENYADNSVNLLGNILNKRYYFQYGNSYELPYTANHPVIQEVFEKNAPDLFEIYLSNGRTYRISNLICGGVMLGSMAVSVYGIF